MQSRIRPEADARAKLDMLSLAFQTLIGLVEGSTGERSWRQHALRRSKLCSSKSAVNCAGIL
jgi:hypothetical protein